MSTIDPFKDDDGIDWRIWLVVIVLALVIAFVP